MSRGSTTGPFKSTEGFEIGAGGSGPDGTNTTVIDSDGNITAPGTLSVTGTSTLSGQVTQKKAVATVLVSGSITEAQSGTTFFCSTSGGEVIVQLPATVAGVGYTFIADVDLGVGYSPLRISPNKADKIEGTWSTSSTTTYFVVNGGTDDYDILGASGAIVAGDYITVLGDGSIGWYITGGMGDWADKGAT